MFKMGNVGRPISPIYGEWSTRLHYKMNFVPPISNNLQALALSLAIIAFPFWRMMRAKDNFFFIEIIVGAFWIEILQMHPHVKGSSEKMAYNIVIINTFSCFSDSEMFQLSQKLSQTHPK